tara:strand:+ start:129 stop:284 length:156 start_codon:yes stop_codon:yes gene_type:complete
LIADTTNDFLIIQPSGNPITADGLVDMHKNEDLNVQSSFLKKIYRLEAKAD